jgi:disulfide bond formation protein DsbB
MTDRHADIAHEIMKSAPPVAATTGIVVFGMTLNEWVAIATLCYIAIQAVILIRRELRERKAYLKAKKEASA